MEREIVVETKGLTKKFPNGPLAVDGLDIQVAAGEVLAVLGANGAGKTTTVMMLLGLIEPSSGTASICGLDIVREPLEAKRHVAYVSENVALYDAFTPVQNLEFFARLAGKRCPRAELERVLLDTGLPAEALRRRVGGFSKGMRQRVGIALAVVREARAILLDEPTSGLDPKGGREFLALLDRLRGEGRAIWMTTHDVFRVREIADRVAVMVQGRLAALLGKEELAGVDLEELYIRYVDSA